MDSEIVRDARGFEVGAGWGGSSTAAGEPARAFHDREETQSLPDDRAIAGPIWLTILVDAAAGRPRSVPLALEKMEVLDGECFLRYRVAG